MNRVILLSVFVLLSSGCFMTGFDANANSLTDDDLDGQGGDGDGDRAGDGDGDGDRSGDGDGDGDAVGDGDGDGDAVGDGDGDGDLDGGTGDGDCAASGGVCPECSEVGIRCMGDIEVTCSEALRASTRSCQGGDNECTVTRCIDGVGCQTKPVEGDVSCGHGRFCNAPGVCVAGSCVLGAELDCTAIAGPCTRGVCNEDKDRCEPQPANGGVICGTGAVCDSGVCKADQCEGACSLSCDEGARNCQAACGGALDCDVTCAGRASCAIDCSQAEASCGVACATGSQCHVKCGAQQSCVVDCADGAGCLLDCGDAGGDNCAFAACETQLACDGGLIACGRPCPPTP
jgi:hypothetical protein